MNDNKLTVLDSSINELESIKDELIRLENELDVDLLDLSIINNRYNTQKTNVTGVKKNYRQNPVPWQIINNIILIIHHQTKNTNPLIKASLNDLFPKTNTNKRGGLL